MDADRFDHLSRTFAERTTRRRAFRGLAGGGFLAAFGLSRVAAIAQGDSATCALDLVANVRLGPNEAVPLGGQTPGELKGQLRFAIGEQGRLVDGRLRLENNMEFNAVGQVAGPSITIRIAVPPNQTIVLVGAGENALRSCNGAVDGMMTGPAIGDLGDWHAVATQVADAPSAIQPTQASGAVAATQPSGGNPTAPSQPTATETATAEPTATATSCVPIQGACDPTAGNCCAGLICEVGTCLVPTGGACTSANECATGICLNGFCTFLLELPTETPCIPDHSPCDVNNNQCCADRRCAPEDLNGPNVCTDN